MKNSIKFMVLYPIKTIDMSHLPIIFPRRQKNQGLQRGLYGSSLGAWREYLFGHVPRRESFKDRWINFWMGKSELRKPPIPMTYEKYEKYGCFLQFSLKSIEFTLG
jgi:hypothetical protein